MKYEPKPAFKTRMCHLLESEEEYETYLKTLDKPAKRSLRINTLKTTPKKIHALFKKNNWQYSTIKNHPEILRLESDIEPGAFGKTKEHMFGHYYIQEITSMMPMLALNPQPGELLIDIAAAPGSKTTQAAAMMKNEGTIIANDISIPRIAILVANLKRMGITNTIVTRHEGEELCAKVRKQHIQPDKILLDAPCSGEGNIRISPRTLRDWSEKLIEKLSRKQKKLAHAAVQLLKPGGEMLYSTCTFSPEENELVIQDLIEEHDLEILPIGLPIKTRPGITEWNNKKLAPQLKHAVRIYPHDQDLEGFFLCKIRKIS